MGLQYSQHHLDLYVEKAVERHKIYMRRMAGEPKPWSEDPIYQNYFFCNIFRKYDKCSLWMIKNIIPLNRFDLIVLYRYISTMEIYEKIDRLGIAVDDLKAVHDLMDGMYSRGERIFNGCFLRNTRIGGGLGEGTYAHKIPFILMDIMKEAGAYEKILTITSFKEMVEYLVQFPTIAGFFAYEYACDWEYTDLFNPTDKNTWANKGPGAQRGLSLVVHGNQYQTFSQEEWLAYIRDLFVIMKERFNKEFPWEDFSMREIEHQLCEFQKYCKYKENMETGERCKFRYFRS